MKEYKIRITARGEVTVSANSDDEAEDKALNIPLEELPLNWDYEIIEVE